MRNLLRNVAHLSQRSDRNASEAKMRGEWSWVRRSLSVSMIALLVILTGCRGGSSGTYRDNVYGFSFKIPSGWQAPNGGKRSVKSNRVPTYTLQFITPTGLRVVVDGLRVDVSKVPNGRLIVGKAKAGCPDFCEYLQIRVSRRPALLVEKLDAFRHLYGELVFVNSRKRGYEIALTPATAIASS